MGDKERFFMELCQRRKKLQHNDHHQAHQFLRKDSVALPSGTRTGTVAFTSGLMAIIVGCFLFGIVAMTKVEDTAICPLLELSQRRYLWFCSWSGLS